MIQFFGESVAVVVKGFQYLDEITVKKLQQRFQYVRASLEYPVLYVPVCPHRLAELISEGNNLYDHQSLAMLARDKRINTPRRNIAMNELCQQITSNNSTSDMN